MAIKNPIVNEDRAELFNEEFREVIEKNLTRIRNASDGVTEVPRALQLRYVGDFYGLLSELKVPYSHWWTTLRINGMSSPLEYQGAALFIKTHVGEISSLLRNWNNTYRR